MLQPRTRALAGLLFLLAIGLIVYRPWRAREFVYDDILVIRDNAFIAAPANLGRLFGTSYLYTSGEQTYRPVVTATYILDHALWGKAPFGYAFTNFLIALAAAWLLALVVRRAAPPFEGAAWLAAALYLAHPALVETIAVPSNREQILSVLLMLLAARAWDSPRRAVRLISPLALLAACYTLEWSVLLPVFLVLWALVAGDPVRRALARTAPEWAVVLAYLVLRVTVQPAVDVHTPWLGGGPLGGLRALGTIFWTYVRLALLPGDLRPNYTFAFPAVAWSALGLLAVFGVAAIAAVGLLRRRRWALGLTIFGLGLAPVAHVAMPFWIPLAERYLALPLVGGLPLLAMVIWRAPAPWRYAVAAFALACFALLATQQADRWRTNFGLWSSAVEIEPDDPVSWTNYGASLAARGLFEPGLEAHRRAWDLARDAGRETSSYPLNVGNDLEKTGDRPAACRLLVDQIPRFPTDRELLVTALRDCRQTRDAGALALGRGWLEAHPRDCRAWSAYCVVDPAASRDCVARALERCPSEGELWLHAAVLLRATHQGRAAAQAVARAIAVDDSPRLRADALNLLDSWRRDRP